MDTVHIIPSRCGLIPRERVTVRYFCYRGTKRDSPALYELVTICSDYLRFVSYFRDQVKFFFSPVSGLDSVLMNRAVVDGNVFFRKEIVSGSRGGFQHATMTEECAENKCNLVSWNITKGGAGFARE